MAKLVCLQSGHENISSNCDLTLRSSTGAVGEKDFTVRIRNRLSQILQTKGFAVQLVDANFNCSTEAGKDFALFLAIHYDANVYGTGGGFDDFPEPSTDDATVESQRIAKAIEIEYFSGNTGIVNHPERRNKNTKFYYMWKYLSSATPCVLIECGVGQDPHDSVILADTDRVCNGIARGICKAFGVPFDVIPPVVVPPPVDPCLSVKAELTTANQTIASLKTEITNKDKVITTKDATISTLTTKLSQIKTLATV